MRRLLECVPNFSEGRDAAVIKAIADAISSVEQVKLLGVEPGMATNRTVYTFVGEPDAVVEAAVRAAAVGSQLIDMQRHHGEHPRFGALDVCPLVPVTGISMDEAAQLARELGRRLGEELGLTIYLYEKAASSDQRRNLANVRAGEYEGLPQKLRDPAWQPDFGPATFNARSGASAVGAREFLIAYNMNLNTTSVRRANAIAFDVREKGRVKRQGDPLLGEVVRDAAGQPLYEPGALRSVKAIGWFIEEYGIAQISMNLTDITVTSLHEAFDQVVEKAAARGVRVTGSQLIGLVPLKSMLEAGRHFLRKQQRSLGVPDHELIRVAVRSLGLNELEPFVPEERIIEYAVREAPGRSLLELRLAEFVETTASEAAAPGGGSVAALLGALGAALATMVANLSAHKRGWDARWEEFSAHAERGKDLYTRLLELVQRDTAAFDQLMAAFGMPQTTEAETAHRADSIQSATRRAIEVPLEVMRTSVESMELIAAMAEHGNPNSVSDAGVAALCARSAVLGAFLNVRINAPGIDDRQWMEQLLAEGEQLCAQAREREQQILASVESKL